MRFAALRLSPASPPDGQTPRRRSTASKAKAGGDGKSSTAPTSVRETGLSAPASVNPLAPASAALEGRGSVGDSPELNLRYLRPAPDERETWNRRLGRVDSRPDDKARYDTIYPLDDSRAERLITTQAPQRPQSTPTFQIQVDGRTVPVFEGQTILEVCRASGIEVPTLCYEPKLPGFGACRMCVVEVEGEEHPPISCSRLAEPGMVVQTQTEKVRRLRRTNLELIFSDHNAYCLPPCQNKCPSHIDIPGFLKANAEGRFRESARIFKRTIPFPSILGRVCPAPCEEHCRRDEVDEAIAIRDSHRYAGDIVLREQKEGIAPPLPFEMEAKTGKRVAIVGSGPAGMAAAYYLLMSGHEVTVFEKDPEPGGMLRYGIPEYRLPKAEILDPEYEAVWRLGGRLECNRALGKDFSLEDLERHGFDATIVAIGCYNTNKLGAENEDADGVIDGLDYLRTATLGLPYPGHKGSRVVVIGGGFTAMDCSRTSVRQGAKEITLVYRRDMKDMPAYSEAHEAMEEGVKMIFEAGPTRVVADDKGKVTGVEFIRMHPGEPDASGRRRPEPTPGSEFVIDCDRVLLAIGQAPDLTWIGGPSDGIASNRGRLQADAVTFETGRPGVFGTGDVRIGSATVVQAIAEGRRCAYAVDAYVKGVDLSELRQRQTLAETQPTFLSIVPFTDEPKEARYRLKTVPARERRKNYDEYEVPYTAAEVMAESTRCLQCTCEAVGFCDLRRLGIEYGTTLETLEPGRDQGAGFRSVTENRFTGTNHDYIRDDSHAFILREPSRCIDCGRCASVCADVVGAACYDFMRSGFDTLVTTPLDMSLNDTPCVSCGRCAETCPTGALMPKPRVLTKYDVDESRCILCGICVDACPYDALRDGQDNEISHTSRANPQIDLLALADVDRETEVTYVQRERDWVARATAEGRLQPPTYDEYELPASLATPSKGGSGRGARKP
jgi:NADPH-dependent glutamate synthase beta subunit-like oxidoreductase/formate hydrogenlyase subunit 6/NADH:ubiquinone oxidoreductase subunit I/ferredoxin